MGKKPPQSYYDTLSWKSQGKNLWGEKTPPGSPAAGNAQLLVVW
jgi:hypothetical protein